MITLEAAASAGSLPIVSLPLLVINWDVLVPRWIIPSLAALLMIERSAPVPAKGHSSKESPTTAQTISSSFSHVYPLFTLSVAGIKQTPTPLPICTRKQSKSLASDPLHKNPSRYLLSMVNTSQFLYKTSYKDYGLAGIYYTNKSLLKSGAICWLFKKNCSSIGSRQGTAPCLRCLL